jgi:hypothetical protein
MIILADFPPRVDMYNVEVKIAGVWTDWYDTKDKFMAFAIAGQQADRYGEDRVRIVDPKGKIL